MKKNTQTSNWLENYNDSNVNLPQGYVGEGIFNGPIFENPAVKGQFQMGGNIPGAVGHMYARTGAPSKGPRRNQTDVTDASAQNGKEMQYYQQGLDWKPKSISQNGSYNTGDKVTYGTPEYREAYNRGEVITDEGVRSPIQLDEVVIKGKKKDKNWLEQYASKIAEENRDAGLLGAIIGTPISAITSLPQLMGMKALTGEMQRPSEGLDIKNPYGAMAVDAIADPSTWIGVGELSGLSKLTKEKALAKLSNLKNINAEGKIFSGMNNQLNSIVKNTANTSKNLEDLTHAKDWAKQYGYELPENLERIAQSDELTNRTVRGMMNRHNTFVRGVSTNWDELATRNPEILRHLEGKGIDWQNNPKAAAEYMATHVPIQTGYGRADLNQQVFGQGLDAIYTSNSIPTAEGYTYGQGYITKVKKPTDFSSLDRKDWITKNNPEYYENSLPSSRVFSVENLDQLNPKIASDFLEQGRINNDEYKKMLKYFEESNNKHVDLHKEHKISELPESIWDQTPEHDEIFDNYYNALKKEKEAIAKNLFFEDYSGKTLRTERAPISNSVFHTNKIIDKFLATKGKNTWSSAKGTSEGEKLYQDIINIQKNNPDNNKAVLDFIQKNYPEFDPIDRYSHYIHLGTPGEKILEPIKSWEITPDIWKNKSRAHTNAYSKKLSAMEEGGIIKDDRGQWDHPGEITEIGSNEITMEGVHYDVLGVSDTGDTKLMKPGKNYKFKGKKVTEYPMAKNGVNQQDQKTLQQLDQLTNFTNYNKPQPGGWLEAYK
jgi:hypothetical protein